MSWFNKALVSCNKFFTTKRCIADIVLAIENITLDGLMLKNQMNNMKFLTFLTIKDLTLRLIYIFYSFINVFHTAEKLYVFSSPFYFYHLSYSNQMIRALRINIIHFFIVDDILSLCTNDGEIKLHF